MTYDPQRHHRRSIRLKGYDYAQPGAYFVTVCTHNRGYLFGDVVDGAMRLNDPGRMVQKTWHEIPKYYPGVEVDAFVVMPNHIHGIIVLVGAGPRACPDSGPRACPDSSGQPQGVAPTALGPSGPGGVRFGQPQRVAPTGSEPRRGTRTLALPDVVHRFKTLTTKRYVDGVKNQGWTPFPGRLWQRNYYEHIIRSEDELNRIRTYIVQNPLKWESDRENRTRADRAGDPTEG